MIERGLPWAAPLLATATFAWLARALGLGLEPTDEAYYLLSALHAGSIELFFTPFHWVTGPLWQASGSLFVFRAMGLGLCAGAAVLLAWAVLRAAPRAGIAVPQGRAARTAVLATGASGALVYGSLLSFTPSYNLLAAAGSCAGVALGLLAIVGRPAWAAAAALAGGAVLGLTTLAKFPAGIGSLALVALLWVALATLREAARVLLVGAGAVAAVGMVAWANGGFAEALAQFRAGVEVIWSAQGDHTTAGRVLRSAGDAAGMLRDALAAFWAPLALVLAGAVWRKEWLGLAGIAWLAVALAAGGHLAGGYDRFLVQAQPLVALLLAVLLAKARDLGGGVRSVALLGGLVLLPFAVAIGTSNPLQVQVLGALAPWGVVLGVLAFAPPVRWPALLAGLMFALTVLLQVVGHGQQPYRMRPLSQQAESVVVPQLGALRVDRETAAMLRALSDAAARCGIRPGAPFIDLYNLPVAALPLQGRPLVAPWMLDADYASRVLRRADPVRVRQASLVLKLDAQGRRPDLPPQLAQFPGGWRFCGSGVAPLDGHRFEVWAPAA